MADEPNNQSALNSIGLVVIAVLLAVTATHTLSIKDTRPQQAEIGAAAGSQKSVVYSQLWDDPFQAVDRYFQQQNDTPGQSVPPVDNTAPECHTVAQTAFLAREASRACVQAAIKRLNESSDAIEKAVLAGVPDTTIEPFKGPDIISDLKTALGVVPGHGKVAKMPEGIQPWFNQLKHVDRQRRAWKDIAADLSAGGERGWTLITNALQPEIRQLEKVFISYQELSSSAIDMEDNIVPLARAVKTEHDLLGADLAKIDSAVRDIKEPEQPPTVAAANPCGTGGSISEALPPNECVQGADSTAKLSQLKIIAVMVNGGSFESVTESRRRQRYSVVSALKVSGYQPEDQDRIHLTNIGALLCGPSDAAACRRPPFECEKRDQRGCVPFERFRLSPFDILKPQGRSAEILVLWIRDDDVFNLRGLGGLHVLTNIARNVYPSNGYNKSALAVVGPPNSNSLGLLFKDVIGQPVPPKPPCNVPYRARSGPEDAALEQNEIDPPCQQGDYPHPGLHIFDDQATKGLPFEVKDTLSFNADPSIGMKYRFPECLPGNQAFCFSRTGAPDASLASELAYEIGRHQLGDGSFRMLLLVDGGNVFAQSLEHHLYDYLSSHSRGRQAMSPEDVLVTYFYPGLDGHLSGEFNGSNDLGVNDKHAPGRQGETASAKSNLNTGDLAAHATGPVQVDYLRRLQTLAETRRGNKPIGAVGIVSTDIYDKLLIIQALRPIFPKALFFTTNLDAQMAEPDMISATRGTVVASNFGLHSMPISGTNIGIPVFRDDYETANFLTTIYISQCDVNDLDQLSEASTTDLCDRLKVVVDPTKPPPLYQIGYNGTPLQLTHRQGAGLPSFDGTLSIPARLLIGLGFAGAIVGVRYVNLLALGKSPAQSLDGLRRSTVGMDRRFWVSAAAFAVPASILAFWPAISHILTESGEGEALGWMDGLSLWPAVWLQVVACFVAAWFIHLVFCLLNRNTIVLAQKFRLDSRMDVVKALRTHKVRMSVDVLLQESSAELLGKRRGLNMNIYWHNYYLGRCAVNSRSMRAAALTGLVFAIIGLVKWAYPGDPLLGRGRIVNIAYAGSSDLCALLVIFLVCLVFDAALNSRRFVSRVRRAGETFWPPKTVQHFGDKLGFVGPRLSDWIDLRFTGTRTAVILVLVWFPFLVIALMMSAKVLAARINETSFIVEISVVTAMLMFCVASLRTEAEKQRSRALKRLQDLASRLPEPLNTDIKLVEGSDQSATLITSDGTSTVTAGVDKDQQPSSVPRPRQIELLIERIKAMNEGAFIPAVQQPLVKAILLPIAAGAWPIIEHYAAR